MARVGGALPRANLRRGRARLRREHLLQSLSQRVQRRIDRRIALKRCGHDERLAVGEMQTRDESVPHEGAEEDFRGFLESEDDKLGPVRVKLCFEHVLAVLELCDGDLCLVPCRALDDVCEADPRCKRRIVLKALTAIIEKANVPKAPEESLTKSALIVVAGLDAYR